MGVTEHVWFRQQTGEVYCIDILKKTLSDTLSLQTSDCHMQWFPNRMTWGCMSPVSGLKYKVCDGSERVISATLLFTATWPRNFFISPFLLTLLSLSLLHFTHNFITVSQLFPSYQTSYCFGNKYDFSDKEVQRSGYTLEADKNRGE
jgi:hypothetical protein